MKLCGEECRRQGIELALQVGAANQLKGLHKAEVRYLDHRAEELQREVFRYKDAAQDSRNQRDDMREELNLSRARELALHNALTKELGEHEETRRLLAQLRAETSKKGGAGLRNVDPVQFALDTLEESIPLQDDNSRDRVREYVTRQIRLRGVDTLDSIIEEAVAGDTAALEED